MGAGPLSVPISMTEPIPSADASRKDDAVHQPGQQCLVSLVGQERHLRRQPAGRCLLEDLAHLIRIRRRRGSCVIASRSNASLKSVRLWRSFTYRSPNVRAASTRAKSGSMPLRVPSRVIMVRVSVLNQSGGRSPKPPTIVERSAKAAVVMPAPHLPPIDQDRRSLGRVESHSW